MEEGSMTNFLSRLCLAHGSTLQGRQDAYRHKMRQNKLVPVLVQENPARLLIPTGPSSSRNTSWVFFHAIETIEPEEKAGSILFRDGISLKVESCARFCRQYQSCSVYIQFLQSSQSSQ